MRIPLLFLFSALLCTVHSFSQISFTGNSSSATTPVNAPAIIVDNSLLITSGVSFDGAKVSVSTNFNSGDLLSYTGSLPSGVSAAYNGSTGVLSFTGTATAAQYQDLLRTVTFATSSAVATQRTVLFNLGVDFAYAANGHLYEFVAGTFTWTDAKTDAATRTKFGMQGYLTTITSAGENGFITLKLASNGWIGASDDDNYINGGVTYADQAAAEGKWYWATGPEAGTQFSNNNGTPTQLTYMNWNSGEPNNAGTIEHYGQIFASVSTGEWNDLPNTSLLGYVVEYGGIGTDPVVDIVHTRNIKLMATSLQATVPDNTYELHAPPAVVDNAFILYSSGNITNAKVNISNGFNSGDVLGYTVGSLPPAVTGSYNASTGVLSFTGTATPGAWLSLFRTVSFYSSSNTIDSRTISFSVGNLISGSNGHFYETVSSTANWSNAKTGASGRTYLGLQGYLATITSQDENDFIQEKLSADAWIGLSDQWDFINPVAGTSYAAPNTSEGKWYWITGPEAGHQITTANAPNSTSLPPVFGSAYNNWNSGEPNNSSSAEHFAQIYSTGASPGKWNDLTGSTTLPYVVEYGGLPTDPLLQLSATRTMFIAAILPVRELQFQVVKNQQKADIKWSTTSETNTFRFDVLHSVDGINFTKLAEIPAARNSNSLRTYSFRHEVPSHGANFYKLKLIDIDEKFSYSDVRQLNFSGSDFTISPNPVITNFIVSNPFDKNSILTLKNTNGAVVFKQTINSSQASVNISYLPAGVYFAVLVSEQQRSKVIKLIKK
ncbi:lectin-like protein [Flavitalea sp.]|nr:lectin-like protein [Flavitalea sp.]